MTKKELKKLASSQHPVLQRAAEIIDALNKGKFKVEYDEPNNVEQYTDPTGEPFIVIRDLDDARSANDFGGCTVTVADECFECPWGYEAEVESSFFDELDKEGWEEDVYGDDIKDAIVDALCDADGVLVGEHCDFDGQLDVINICGYDTSIPVYWYDSSDCPISDEDFTPVSELSEGEVSFGDERYYMVDSPDWDNGTVLAVNVDASPSPKGSYTADLLHIEQSDTGEIIVTSVEEGYDEYDTY